MTQIRWVGYFSVRQMRQTPPVKRRIVPTALVAKFSLLTLDKGVDNFEKRLYMQPK